MNLNEDIDINELVESVLKEQKNEEAKKNKKQAEIDDQVNGIFADKSKITRGWDYSNQKYNLKVK